MALTRSAARLIALPWAVALACAMGVVTLVLGLWVVVVDALCWPFVRARRTPGVSPIVALPGGVRRRVSAVTVSWNGRHFLQQLLPSLQRELEQFVASGEGCEAELIVVDNGSTDGTVEWLREQWRDTVRVVALPENQFFVRGCMAGVNAARFETLVVLNNDMVVQPGFLDALLRPLVQPGVFAVSSQIFLLDESARREESGLTGGEFRHGVLKLAHLIPELDQLDRDARVPTLWAGGGSSAYDRDAFMALGGFDTLYDPFYVEDMALSYGAWSRGWHVLFAADSQVHHAHRGTSRKAFGDRFIDGMIRRNQHLFTWKMVHGWRETAGALATVPLLVLARWRSPRPFGQPWFEASALLRALPRFPRALLERQRVRKVRVRSDGEVFATAASIHRTARSLHACAGPASASGGPLKLLFLAGRLPRRGVDGSWVLLELLLSLARRGHRVTLLAVVESEAERTHAGELEEAGVGVQLVVRRSFPAVANLHRQTPDRLARDYSHPDLAVAVQRVLRAVDFDVVQVDYVEMAHLAAPYLGRVRAVYVCHEAQELAARRSGAGGFEVRRAAIHEQELLGAFTRTVCLSPADRDVLQGASSSPVAVIPSAISLADWGDAAAGSASAGNQELLFVGSFAHAPNVDAVAWLLTEVLPAVRISCPEVTLRIVGAGAPPELRAVADGVVGVTFAGFVEDLAAVHRHAAVVVAPLRQGGGLRGKVLEAWAGGCAVVGTSVAVAGLHAVSGEHLLVADDGITFAAAVVAVLQDRALGSRLGAAGRRLVEEAYTTEAQVVAYEALYREAVEAVQ